MPIRLLLLLLLFGVTYQIDAQSPTIFLDGIVSTNLSERDMAISPDGNDMFYTIQSNQHVMSTVIHRKKLSSTKWSDAEIASFSGQFSDLEPAFSPDGKKLYFASNRTLTGDGTKDYDIWVCERTSNGWSTPKNLGDVVNTKGNEFYPSITNDGTVYWTAEYDNGIGKEDIFFSKFINGAYTKAMPLDTAVNSALWEFNAFVASDESFILFTSYGRKDDQGGGDLYISQKKDGNWQPATNLKSINSPQLDYCPFVQDRKLYFTSGRHAMKKVNTPPIKYDALLKLQNGTLNGAENIYWVDLKDVLK